MADAQPPAIEFDHVTKAFGPLRVLDDVSLRIDAGRLSSRERSSVRRRIGFLFQNAALFDSIRVGENVEFPLRRHTRLADRAIRARARQLLAQVGLARGTPDVLAASDIPLVRQFMTSQGGG